jgi:hypothetical protein
MKTSKRILISLVYWCDEDGPQRIWNLYRTYDQIFQVQEIDSSPRCFIAGSNKWTLPSSDIFSDELGINLP